MRASRASVRSVSLGLLLSRARLGGWRSLALVGREVLQVNHDGEVEARLGRNDVVAVLPLQHLLGAVLHQVLEASYLDREHDLALGFGGRDMEQHAVEVRDRLINRYRRGTKRPVIVALASPPLLLRGEGSPGGEGGRRGRGIERTRRTSR